MKRVSKKLLCFLLMMLMVVCSLPTLSISAETIENDAETLADDVCENAGRTGDLDLVTDTPDDVFVIENLEDYYAVTNEVGTSKKDIAQTSSQTVVKFVDKQHFEVFSEDWKPRWNWCVCCFCDCLLPVYIYNEQTQKCCYN